MIDCQVMESVWIEEMASRTQESLNLKSEWGGSKLPGLHVSKPKGTAKTQNQKEGTKRGRLEEGSKEEKMKNESQPTEPGPKRVRQE